MFDDDVDDDDCESTLFKEKRREFGVCVYVYFGVVTTTGVVFQERYVGIV